MTWLGCYYRLCALVGPFVDACLHCPELLSSSRKTWSQRRGTLPEEVVENAPYDLWIHGASVGEVSVIKAILQSLFQIRPQTKTIVSTFTVSGLQYARKTFDEKIKKIHCPLDYPQAIKRALSIIRPKVFCTVETEMWPSLIFALKKKKTGLILLNGRISNHSFNSYKRFRFLFSDVLDAFDAICAISERDMERFIAIGADEKRIRVCGNAKYEYLITRAEREPSNQILARLASAIDAPIIVAGSIRQEEYRLLVEVSGRLWKEGMDHFLILVPRHLDRVEEIRDFLTKKKREYSLFSRFSKGKDTLFRKSILIVDEIGLLFELYQICHIAFVGGSLPPLGGQNVMEPAAWEKPVVFGPNIWNFEDAAEALVERGGGFMVKDETGLFPLFRDLLKGSRIRKKSGKAAKETLIQLGKGAATNQALSLSDLLDKKTERAAQQ